METVLRPLAGCPTVLDLRKLAKLVVALRKLPKLASGASFDAALAFAKRFAVTKAEAHALVFVTKAYKRSLRRRRTATSANRRLGFVVSHRRPVRIRGRPPQTA